MSHLFALYFPQLSQVLSSLDEQGMCSFKDADTWHRLVKIVRLKPNEPFVLFNEQQHAEMVLHEQTFAKKRMVVANVNCVTPAVCLKPTITLACGLLKRAAFESMVYTATQMGVTEIVPLLTQRVHRSWEGERERKRLKDVMVAAAKQSKYYAFPTIGEPCTNDEFVARGT